MGFEGDIVERHLGCPVDGIGEVSSCHLAQTSRGRPKRYELWLLCFQKQWTHSLEEQDDSKHVDLKMLEQVGNVDFVNLWKHLGNTCIRNDDIQSGNPLALDILDGCGRVGFRDAIDLSAVAVLGLRTAPMTMWLGRARYFSARPYPRPTLRIRIMCVVSSVFAHLD